MRIKKFAVFVSRRMADDGLLVNFEAGNLQIISPSWGQYKGRWKARALNKKWDRFRAQKAVNGVSFVPATAGASQPARPASTTIDEGRTGQVQPETTENIENVSSRPLKRKRKSTSTTSANATPVAARTFPSSSLFTSNPEITSTQNQPTTAPSQPTNAPSQTATTFTSLGISSTISSHLSKSLSISTPTEIQQLAIPHLLSTSHDTFLRAQTGSGKTLAFVLPILHALLSLSDEHYKYDRTSGLFAIILSPTRELAKQIEHVLTKLTAGTWIVPGWLLGGERKKSEKARLRKGVNILVSTPGRLADHLETTEALDTSSVRWMVLDEGDRLVDLGFLETVGKILRTVEWRVDQRIKKNKKEGVLERSRLPERLVKILCSATLKGEEGLGALETIVDPVFLKAETDVLLEMDEVDHVFTPGQLVQKAVILPAKLRFVTLCALIASFAKTPPPAKMIIFLSCTTSVDYHHQLLQSYDIDMQFFQLHGSLEQPVRTATLNKFVAVEGRAVLLATDVASRGLDLPYVDFIVQVDPPTSQDDYIHRIGRTARAGRTGQGILFLLPSEEEYITALASHGAQIERVPYESILADGFGKDWVNQATSHQLHAEKWVLQDQEVSISF